MRFALVFFVVFLSHNAWADIPVPSQKPTKNTFQALIDRAVSDIQRDNPMEESVAQIAPVLPPALPEAKKIPRPPAISISTIEKTAASVIEGGVPIPSQKPTRSNFISLRSSEDSKGFLRLPPQQERQAPAAPKSTIIQYQAPEYDERTAGRKTRSDNTSLSNSDTKISRVYAQPSINLRETNDKSPFGTTKLPKADRTAMGEPIIIFFKENSPELEVGQLDILKDDVLRPLQRSRNIHATIYGFAVGRNSDAAQQLSQQRALMIQEYLDQNRIKSDRIIAYGQGSDTPIDPKDRVDIILSQ